MEPPLDLERFATLSAELTAGTQRDELCAREGISLADWNASQEAWLARLADETAGKRFVLTNRYNNAFVARRRALTHGPRFPAQKPVAARPVPPVAPPPPLVVSMPALAIEPAPIYREAEPPPAIYREPEPPPHRPVRAPTVALPAFTEPVTTALPFAPIATVTATESTTEVGQSPFAQRTALPFKSAGPTEPSAAPPVVALSSDDLEEVDDPLRTTTAQRTSPFATSAAALPFQAAAPVAAAPPSVRQPPVKPSPPTLDGGSTVYGAISPFAAQAPALPFQHAGPQPSPPARTPTPHVNQGLPFQPTALPAPAPPPRPAPAVAAPPAPVAAAPPRPVPAAAPPAPVVAASPAVAPGPPPSPSAVGTTRLTLEQFASLTAEIAVNPRAVAQIRARYGFDEASHRAEAEEHNRRFTADKALYTRYMELFQAYREYVARAPR